MIVGKVKRWRWVALPVMALVLASTILIVNLGGSEPAPSADERASFQEARSEYDVAVAKTLRCASAAGVNVKTEPGPHGVFNSFTIDFPGFSTEEAARAADASASRVLDECMAEHFNRVSLKFERIVTPSEADLAPLARDCGADNGIAIAPDVSDREVIAAVRQSADAAMCFAERAMDATRERAASLGK